MNWSAGGFRLATEAEWEFAALAGTATQWSFGDTDADIDDCARTSRNSNSMTREAGRLEPNDWGLYDMHGNVWEWVWDWWGAYPSADETDLTGAAAGGAFPLAAGARERRGVDLGMIAEPLRRRRGAPARRRCARCCPAGAGGQRAS